MNEKTVGMLAKFTGVSVHTIKYYEKIGLLSSARREHSNYRSYDIRACTDIYECMKYKNLGFALKDIRNLIKEADSEAVEDLLKKRLEEIEIALSELQEIKKHVTDYLAETKEIEKKLGNWYIEEMPDFWIRFQTENMEYGKDAQLESDGINFMDYAPEMQQAHFLYIEGLLSQIHALQDLPLLRAFYSYPAFSMPIPAHTKLPDMFPLLWHSSPVRSSEAYVQSHLCLHSIHHAYIFHISPFHLL